MLDKKYLGKNYTKKGNIDYTVYSFGYSAVSIGVTKDTNEDCMRIGNADDYYFFTVADGHWGPNASETMIDAVIDDLNDYLSKITYQECFDTTSESKITKDVLKIIKKYNSDISIQGSSETTFLYAFMRKDYLIWLSLGDSFLVLVDNNGSFIENKKFQSWIGRTLETKPLNEHAEVKFVKLDEDWKAFSIMSDGITECVSGKILIDGKMIASEMKSNIHSEDVVKTLCQKAFDFGGEDNIVLFCTYREEVFPSKN